MKLILTSQWSVDLIKLHMLLQDNIMDESSDNVFMPLWLLAKGLIEPNQDFTSSYLAACLAASDSFMEYKNETLFVGYAAKEREFEEIAIYQPNVVTAQFASMPDEMQKMFHSPNEATVELNTFEELWTYIKGQQ